MSHFVSKAQDEIHLKISKNLSRLHDWYMESRKGYAYPFYTSVDVRDSGFKIAVVDANIYPAGFNNICVTDRESAGPAIENYLRSHYGKPIEKIGLLCEEHTNNLNYWDNVLALKEMIETTGRQVRVTIPKKIDNPIELKTATGRTLTIYPFIKESERSLVGKDFVPDIIISNNDFSDANEIWAQGLSIPINPPRELGWYQRRKSTHFKFYNSLANEVAALIDVDPWMLQVKTDVLFDCDLGFAENREEAAQKAQQMIDQIKIEYEQKGVREDPVLFVKNNSGTYGLAVAVVKSGEEILSWNSKARTKMKAAKGGHGVTELLFQEGIPSTLKVEGATCEPAVYLLGCELAGAFLRAHNEKGATESLNSPGALYKRLCVTDLKVDVAGSPMENVYGLVARMASLAIGREAQEMGIVYTDYNIDGGCPGIIKS